MIASTATTEDITYGSKNDIRLSISEYYDLIQPLREHNFDRLTMMKYRNLFVSNSLSGITILFGSFIPSYIASKLVIGPFLKGPATHRLLYPMTFVFSFLLIHRFSLRRIPRRLYTELLTDESQDGVYLRETLREKTPGLWKQISH